jgi:hypothetical protein
MKSGLDPGVFAEMRVVVTPDMCPHFDGVLVHPVYATWTLVHHMEIVGSTRRASALMSASITFRQPMSDRVLRSGLRLTHVRTID